MLPDPFKAAADDDEERVSNNRFNKALKSVLEDVGGNTFFVCATNLSHVGPQFGEPRKVDDQRRFDVEKHDREMLGKFLEGDAEEFIGAIKWSKNPTRWLGVGCMASTLEVAGASNLELIDYRQAYDEAGSQLVSTASIALF